MITLASPRFWAFAMTDDDTSIFCFGTLTGPAHGSDYVRHGTLESDHPPLAHALRDEITACEPSPHSDLMLWAILARMRVGDYPYLLMA